MADEPDPNDWHVTVLNAEDFDAVCDALADGDSTPVEALVSAVRDTYASPAFERREG